MLFISTHSLESEATFDGLTLMILDKDAGCKNYDYDYDYDDGVKVMKNSFMNRNKVKE